MLIIPPFRILAFDWAYGKLKISNYNCDTFRQQLKMFY